MYSIGKFTFREVVGVLKPLLYYIASVVEQVHESWLNVVLRYVKFSECVLLFWRHLIYTSWRKYNFLCLLSDNLVCSLYTGLLGSGQIGIGDIGKQCSHSAGALRLISCYMLFREIPLLLLL